MNKTNSKIQLHFLASCSLKARKKLKDFLLINLKKERIEVKSVDIVFCNDSYLLLLNRQFLKHDFYTDIISFPLSRANEPLEAEIYISIERVRENASNESISFKNELHRVIFHGILHFCGFKDKSQADIKKMRAMEEKWLMAYFQSSRS